jgi:TRAP-type C4-dicarboxylate transport system permease small subunit
LVTRIVDWYFRLLKFIIVVCLALMVVLVFGNVVLRYAFNSGITVSEELSRWLFVWLIFLGATVAMKEHAHLGMDSVVSGCLRGERRRALSPATCSCSTRCTCSSWAPGRRP